MLEKLISIGEEHYSFELKKLKDIDKSCCKDIENSFYDFDQIKEKVVELHSLQTLSSCDALGIITDEQKQTLGFVEMKGFLQFLENVRDEKQVDKQIAKFDFRKKIEDSLYLLFTIINSNNFKATNSEKEEFYKIRKQYFIATDISLEKNPLEALSMTLDYLSKFSNIDEYLILKLQDKIMNTEFTTQIENPKLINCNELKNLC